MSLQAILDAVLAEGASRIQQIEADAQRQAAVLLQQAHAEGEAQRDRIIALRRARALQAQTRHLQQINQQCALIVSAAREEQVDAVLACVRKHLQPVRQDADYPQVFARLVDEALETLRPSLLEDEVSVLQVDPSDQAVLKTVPKAPRVEYTLDCLGGVVACSADGRVVVINTLEARLQQATPYLRRYLAQVLEERSMVYV